jgi:hypothetical protein
MIRPLLCAVAESVVHDRTTGSISVFNLLESISGDGFPLLIAKAAFLAVWERDVDDQQDYAARFAITLGNAELLAQNVSVNFREKLRNRTTLTVGGLVVPRPGKLTFSLRLSEDTVASYAIDVTATVTANIEADAISSPAPPVP